MKKFILLIYQAVIPEAVRAVLIPLPIRKVIQQVFKSRLLKLIREAEMEMQAEKWPEAIQCWQNVLNEYRRKAPAGIYIKLYKAHRKHGDLETSATVAQQGHQLYPQEIKFAFELAEIAVTRSQWMDAIRYWQSIIDVHGEKTPANIFIKLTRAFRKQNDLDAAETVAQQGHRLYPEEIKLILELAEIAMMQSEWATAKHFWQDLLLHQPPSELPEIYINLALAQRKQGDLNTASKTIHTGLNRFPKAALLLFQSAMLENFKPFSDNHAPGNPAIKYIKEVTIIICVHNAPEQTQRCINSIIKKTHSAYKMMIIDDASAEETKNMIHQMTSQHEHITVIRNDQNIGYTRSANKGLQLADSEWMVLLNSDTIVTDHWLQGLLECAYSDSRIKIVGPLSNAAGMQSIPVAYNADGSYPINILPHNYSPEDMAALLRKVSARAFPKIPILNGFCLLLHKPTLHEIGFLDEINFPRGYGEENDLCLRCVQAGHTLAIANHVYIYHEKSSSFGHEKRKRLTQQGTKKMLELWPTYSYKKMRLSVNTIPAMDDIRNKIGKALNTVRKG